MLANNFAPMLVDDRPAYRQAKSNPICLGCKKGIKEAPPIILGNARSQVLYFHPYEVWAFRHANCQHPPVWRLVVHGLHRIHDEIEDDLPQLNSIAEHGLRIFSQLQIKSDPPSLQLKIKKLEGLLDDLAEVDRATLRILSGRYVPDASNNVGRAPSIRDDPCNGRPYFIDL
jgi:hypothetical protein